MQLWLFQRKNSLQKSRSGRLRLVHLETGSAAGNSLLFLFQGISIHTIKVAYQRWSVNGGEGLCRMHGNYL